MDGQLVGEVAALGHLDRVDVADEVADGGVRRRELLAVPLAAVLPRHRRRVAQLGYDRGYNPAGTARQLAAILADGDRSAELRGVTAPTVVIHGTRDRLVRPSGGRETAKAIPGAQLVEIDGMGHDLPIGAWERIIDAVVSNAQRADTSSRSAAAA